MKKIQSLVLAGLIACGISNAFASISDASPMRVGPVQNYGALGTANGHVISLKTKQNVMLRGMSLYWSDATGVQYYNGEVMAWAVENLGIDVIRFAMGVQYYDGGSREMDQNYSYIGNPDSYLSLLDAMVEAAIKNDIYIIIDWHSHKEHKAQASAFFSKVAEKYKDVPNVIFEIWNEPLQIGWGTIQSYANDVSSKIRQHTQNLILVGTPNWSQMTGYGGVNATNVAYVLHFYAGTHSVGSFGSKAMAAMSEGNAVFISEWGTTNADGDGAPDENSTNQWLNWMEENQVSNCNWSLRQFTGSIDGASEQSAMFEGNVALYNKQLLNDATYTASGKIVSNYLIEHKRSWADSLVAGKNTGECAFETMYTNETAGSIPGANGSCTYTSSADSVATINAGSIEIKKPGFAIFTGNDGSQSVVVVAENPKQTFSGFSSFTCRLDGSCSSGGLRDLTNSGQANKVLVSATGKTKEGATVEVTSLNPEIVSIKREMCSNSKFCYGKSENAMVDMYEFSMTLGSAKVVATAPAVVGYQAMNDTITVTYAKALPKPAATKNYKSQKIPLGATIANLFSDTTAKGGVPITYTFNGQETSPFVSRVNNDLVAGTQDAIIQIVATTPETEMYEAMNSSITIIIGDSAKAVNQSDYENTPIIAMRAAVPFRAELQESGLLLNIVKAGDVEWSIYTTTGKRVMHNATTYSAGSHWISLEALPAGNYVMKVRQGTNKNSFRWNKI